MSSAPYPISRTWWVFVVVGVLNVIIGLLAIAHPGFTLTALGIVLGIALLIGALTALVAGLTGETESRALSVILGVIGILAGLICLRRPGDSLLVLVVAIGLYLVAVGVVRIVVAFAEPGPRSIPLLVGALEIVLGILVLALPDVSLGTLAILFGIAVLFHGVTDIVTGLGLRRLRDTDAAAVRTAGPGLAT